MNDKIDKFSKQIGVFNQKLIELSNLIATDKKYERRLNKLPNLKKKLKKQ